MDIKDIIKEFEDLMSRIGGEFGLRLLEILEEFIPRIELIDELPDWLKPLIQPFAANAFLHMVVAEFKDYRADSAETRTVALKYTRKLFQMPDTWEPSWLMPPVS